MLDKEKYELVMTQILKDIFTDVEISSFLGFKGGTSAYFFYELPRFSVDLDFDLLGEGREKKDVIFQKIKEILTTYGEIKDFQQKGHTLFFLLSYGFGEHGIKVEINTRITGASYEMRQYLGIPVFVANKESMLSTKLIALLRRKKFASRDLYDVYYFLKNNWDIDKNVLLQYGEKDTLDFLKKCIVFVENIPDNMLLEGLGELVEEKEKDFIRDKLKSEVVFLLRIREKQEGKREKE
jgi:predicted nucleotidyltransferase component of viral defense system